MDAVSAAAEMTATRRPPNLVERMLQIRIEEWPVVCWSWLYIFAILSSYYVMRPIRDQMGISGGLENLPWLFTATLGGMILLNIPFGWLVKRLPRTRFIPITYRFFAINILAFAAALHFASPDEVTWIGRIFFVWLSIFNLFIVSIFWQTIVDVFTTEQGKRLFGIIAAGATIGAIAGSAVTALLARSVPSWVLLVGAAALLEVAVFGVRRLSRLSDRLNHVPFEQSGEEAIGGSVLSGLVRTFASPYLVNIALFLLLFAITSTFLYFEQVSFTAKAFSSRGAQTAFFAMVDLMVNALTLGLQVFLTGRVIRLLGIGGALAALPVLSIVGFALVAFAPTLMVVVGFQVARRAGNFGIARPSREILFTVLPREDRYKAKSVIDTVFYRLGDQFGAWGFGLVSALGFARGALPEIATAISIAWLVNAVWLGRCQRRLARIAEPNTSVSILREK